VITEDFKGHVLSTYESPLISSMKFSQMFRNLSSTKLSQFNSDTENLCQMGAKNDDRCSQAEMKATFIDGQMAWRRLLLHGLSSLCVSWTNVRISVGIPEKNKHILYLVVTSKLLRRINCPYEECRLLGCDAVQFLKESPFRRNVMPQSSA
jgi:hypothetical protein